MQQSGVRDRKYNNIIGRIADNGICLVWSQLAEIEPFKKFERVNHPTLMFKILQTSRNAAETQL